MLENKEIGSIWHWSLLVSAVFAVLCWFCAGLCWSLLVSLFCAGFVLVSAGLCRFRCFLLVLCWSLLDSAGFVVLCWFCAGLCWSLPVSPFCTAFALGTSWLKEAKARGTSWLKKASTSAKTGCFPTTCSWTNYFANGRGVAPTI